MNHVARFLHAIHGFAEKFIGSDYLQSRAVKYVAHRRINAMHLGANNIAGIGDVRRHALNLRAEIHHQ